MDLDRALSLLVEDGQPAYRVAQARHAVTRDLIPSWGAATTLPKALRARLDEVAPLQELELEDEQVASDGTRKARFRTADGFPLEAVLMRHDERRAVCLSSQSGCALGCTFCATGAMGMGRNLRSGEIFEQLLWAARAARAEEARIGNVVMMGMGEPFQNYDEVLAFCRLANDPEGYALGARAMAISTAGWVPGIERLAEEPLQVKLALSLHAPDDGLRDQLMPVNRRYPLARLMEACRGYRKRTRRRIFIEYLLLDGVNDSPAHAEALAELLRAELPGGCHVNLIVYNPTGSAYRASPEPVVEGFRVRLDRRGIPVSVRRSKGSDIDAACGQLAVRGAREAREAAVAARRGSRS